MSATVNSVIKNKDCCMQLSDINDKDEQDTMNPTPVAWDAMYSDYCSNDPNLGELCPYASNAMIVHGVVSTFCTDYDKLSIDEFKEVVF